MTNTPPIYLSRRFQKSYLSASVPLQRLIEGATYDLVRGFREMGGQIQRRYDRLRHLQPHLNLLEIDVSGANRMVADIVNDCIHLLDVGGHETVPRYSFGKYQIDKHQSEPAHDAFWPDAKSGDLRFFTRNPCERIAEFGTESKREWIYFLSAQQSLALEDSIDHIFSVADGQRIAPIFIVGGPGTGKTSILLNLLKQTIELGVNARLRCSDRMKSFITAATPGINSDLLVTQSDVEEPQKTKILIVDDPDTKNEITRNLQTWSARNQQLAVVIGFDPCQLSDFDSHKKTSGLSDDSFDDLVKMTNAKVIGLDECYRQKANVGIATQKALRVLADSSPFLADQKIDQFREQHLGVNSIGHDFSFPNPNGYVQLYEGWTDEELHSEIERIRSRSHWSHWPSTLLVFDETYKCDPAYLTGCFSEAGLQYEAVSLTDVATVKGLEYQHLVMFISKETFHNLENGFQGSGQAKYANYRLMRIPLSRPKDTLITFVNV